MQMCSNLEIQVESGNESEHSSAGRNISSFDCKEVRISHVPGPNVASLKRVECPEVCGVSMPMS